MEKEDQPPIKRYRREEKPDSSDDEWKVDSDDDKSADKNRKKPDFVPYVPVKERRKQQLVKLGRLAQIKEAEDRLPLSGLSSGASSGKFYTL
jgi:hypothetical protein